MLFRRVVFLALAAGVASPALAQQQAPILPPAQVPAAANPATGARPGDDIGTGMSLPTSSQAGNITPQDTTSPLAARLPDPDVGENAPIRAYLMAARNALAVGRTGEAQEALERAESRALDRSVPLLQTGTPSHDPLVEQISQALRSLGNGDRLGAVQSVDQAITTAGQRPPAVQ